MTGGKARLLAMSICVFGVPAISYADNTPALAFKVASTIEYETGDSWYQNGHHYRLYGVQSCLRDTRAIDAQGNRHDCGNISLARLVAIFSTAAVSCQPIALARDDATFVVCAIEINGSTIDLGTALISTGYAFAATDAKGNAVNGNYLIAELDAKKKKDGLWGYSFQHPSQVLLKQMQ